jgi:hypothetical protein
MDRSRSRPPRSNERIDDERISRMAHGLRERTVALASALVFRAALAALLCSTVSVFNAAPAGALTLTRLEFLNQSVRLSGQSAVVGMGFRAHLSGGDLNDGFAVMPVVEYWRDKDKAPEIGINEVMQRDWRFGADLRYRLGDGIGWTPYVGGGIAMELTRSVSNVTFPGTGPLQIEDSDTVFAPNLLAGVDLPMPGRIKNSLEIAYDMVPDLKQWKVNFAIGWQFGPLPEDE